MADQRPYNPLDKRNLAISVADAVLSRPLSPLPPSESVNGAGVYVIYYMGDFEPYRPIAEGNSKNKCSSPIYVGKAVPPGARKGGFDLGDNSGPALFTRLADHAASIKSSTSTLKIKDFLCRHLVIDDIWIPLAESLMIESFMPLWNIKIDGFGNHDPGSGRYNQKRSAWDVLHPGRGWAEKLKPYPKSKAEIIADIKDFLKKSPGKKGNFIKPKT